MRALVGEGLELSGGGRGVRSFGRLRLRSSTIDGNTVDILAERRPKLQTTTCSVSRKIGGGSESWGVCPGE